MRVDEELDALTDHLRHLSTPAPGARRAARTRARCHEALTGPRRGRTRVLDALLAVAVVLYGVAIVTEGLRDLLR